MHPPSDAVPLEEVERQHILAVLKQTGGVVEGPKGAARILNLHPNTLRSRMKKLGIKTKRSSSQTSGVRFYEALHWSGQRKPIAWASLHGALGALRPLGRLPRQFGYPSLSYPSASRPVSWQDRNPPSGPRWRPRIVSKPNLPTTRFWDNAHSRINTGDSAAGAILCGTEYARHEAVAFL